MLIRIALFAIPAVAAAGLTLLLNGLHADPGITVASLGLVAVLRGAQKQELYDFGYAAAEASFGTPGRAGSTPPRVAMPRDALGCC